MHVSNLFFFCVVVAILSWMYKELSFIIPSICAEKNDCLMSVECTNVLYGFIDNAKKIWHGNYINRSTAFSALHINIHTEHNTYKTHRCCFAQVALETVESHSDLLYKRHICIRKPSCDFYLCTIKTLLLLYCSLLHSKIEILSLFTCIYMPLALTCHMTNCDTKLDCIFLNEQKSYFQWITTSVSCCSSHTHTKTNL